MIAYSTLAGSEQRSLAVLVVIRLENSNFIHLFGIACSNDTTNLKFRQVEQCRCGSQAGTLKGFNSRPHHCPRNLDFLLVSLDSYCHYIPGLTLGHHSRRSARDDPARQGPPSRGVTGGGRWRARRWVRRWGTGAVPRVSVVGDGPAGVPRALSFVFDKRSPGAAVHQQSFPGATLPTNTNSFRVLEGFCAELGWSWLVMGWCKRGRAILEMLNRTLPSLWTDPA